MERFFGGNPLAVVLKLAIICVVVGIVLNVIGVDPTDLLRGIPDIMRAISQLGWDWVEWVFRFFVLGAIIVVPIWVIVRVVRMLSGDSGRASRS
jgi:Family of unknown function (DUF6460)